jgi:hypothetical protein
MGSYQEGASRSKLSFDCGSAGLQFESFPGDRLFWGGGGFEVPKQFLRKFKKSQVFIHGEGTALPPQAVLDFDIFGSDFDIPFEINH